MTMNELQSEFLKRAVPPAQAAQRKWHVPASVTIAQAILESSNEHGWGQSQLAREANNFFGIKHSHLRLTEHYVEMTTHEYRDGVLKPEMAEFVRYDAIADSFDDHGRLLATAPRYRPAMARTGDPGSFASALQKAGYSTNPHYAKSLLDLIYKFDLMQYDIEPDGPAAAAQEVAA